MNMTLVDTSRHSQVDYEDYDSDYSDQMNNDDIMQVVLNSLGASLALCVGNRVAFLNAT